MRFYYPSVSSFRTAPVLVLVAFLTAVFTLNVSSRDFLVGTPYVNFPKSLESQAKEITRSAGLYLRTGAISDLERIERQIDTLELRYHLSKKTFDPASLTAPGKSVFGFIYDVRSLINAKRIQNKNKRVSTSYMARLHDTLHNGILALNDDAAAWDSELEGLEADLKQTLLDAEETLSRFHIYKDQHHLDSFMAKMYEIRENLKEYILKSDNSPQIINSYDMVNFYTSKIRRKINEIVHMQNNLRRARIKLGSLGV